MVAAAGGGTAAEEEEGSHSGPGLVRKVAEAVHRPRKAGFPEAHHQGWLTQE